MGHLRTKETFQELDVFSSWLPATSRNLVIISLGFFLSSKVNSTTRSKKYYIALFTNITCDTPIKHALISFRLENHYFLSTVHSSFGLEYLCTNPQHHAVRLKCFLLSPVNITSAIKLMNGMTPKEKYKWKTLCNFKIWLNDLTIAVKKEIVFTPLDPRKMIMHRLGRVRCKY